MNLGINGMLMVLEKMSMDFSNVKIRVSLHTRAAGTSNILVGYIWVPKTLILEDHDDDASPSDLQRENPTEHAYLPFIYEQIELVDKLLQIVG